VLVSTGRSRLSPNQLAEGPRRQRLFQALIQLFGRQAALTGGDPQQLGCPVPVLV
jgi:hypothetical protein